MVEIYLNRGLNLLFFLITAARGFFIINGIISLRRSLISHPLGIIALETIALETVALGIIALKTIALGTMALRNIALKRS
jgi:hypothetical protein